jgi:SAM-dependent methyltransferase
MAERLSLRDDTFLAGYANHIQRYQFALPMCLGKSALDAGCGIGYGSDYLARNGAARVVGVDLSDEALAEARTNFSAPNLQFLKADVQAMDSSPDLPKEFDVVVNLENLEHLPHPESFLRCAAARLSRPAGILITSTPNGQISDHDAGGKPCNPFHVREFTAEELVELLKPHFQRIQLFGQWQTFDGRLRVLREKQMHDQFCEAYFNPSARLGRVMKKMLGKPIAPPPQFTAPGESYSWDFTIAPLEDKPFRWPPTVLLAVCGHRIS